MLEEPFNYHRITQGIHKKGVKLLERISLYMGLLRTGQNPHGSFNKSSMIRRGAPLRNREQKQDHELAEEIKSITND